MFYLVIAVPFCPRCNHVGFSTEEVTPAFLTSRPDQAVIEAKKVFERPTAEGISYVVIFSMEENRPYYPGQKGRVVYSLFEKRDHEKKSFKLEEHYWSDFYRVVEEAKPLTGVATI